MKIEQTVGEGSESVYLYYFPSQRVGAKWPCKIGKSKSDPVKRINHQQASMREEPVIGLLIKTRCAAYDEQVLHNALSKCKLASYGKEWYETNPNSALIMYQNCQDDLTLGQQIKLRRYACGMSQADLARTVSVRQATVSSVENDENVEWATLREILRELKLKVQLVPSKNKEKPQHTEGANALRLAGAQGKTAFLFWNDKWHVPHGTTATTHIMKPQIGMLPSGIDLSHSVENEYLCMKLAQAFGLPAANVAIADFKGTRVLVVERFDRLWTKDGRLLRLPQEDCCQALSVPPTRKYESDGGPGMPAVLDLLKASDDPDTDRRLFLKAQIMFWLLGATDGHAKNFSIFLQPSGRFRLTPLYDVMSVQPAFDAGQLRKNQMKFAMAVGDNRHYLVYEIMPRHFVQTAAKSGIPSSFVQTIFDELMESAGVVINRVINVLPAGFPQELAESIVGGLRARSRLADATSARTAR